MPADAADKGDALMLDYARNLMEYVDYYFQFDGWQYDSITDGTGRETRPAGQPLLDGRLPSNATPC